MLIPKRYQATGEVMQCYVMDQCSLQELIHKIENNYYIVIVNYVNKYNVKYSYTVI